jgi:hypothetical protein
MNPQPRCDEYLDFSIVKMAGDDPDELELAREHLNQLGTRAFVAAHPEYYACPMNAAALDNWCSNRGIPCTRYNLEIAFSELREKLENAPPPRPAVVDRWAGIVLSRQDTMAEYVPSDEEKEALAKLADDHNLTTRQRNARLEKLRILAGAQRRALKGQNLYRSPQEIKERER